MTCFRCKKTIEQPVQPIARIFKVMASFSLAPMHGGMWAWEEYSKEYCRACRIKLSVASVVLVAVVAGLGAYAFYWVIRKGLL